MHTQFLTLICLLVFFGCKVSESKLTGKYIDRERDDTLTLMPDKKYEFEERLRNGEHGWNTGNWTIDNNRISFFNTNPSPVVGYKLRIHKMGESEYPLQLIFNLDQSKKKVTFTEVIFLEKGRRLHSAVISIVSNRITAKAAGFDSLLVNIAYFPGIAFNSGKFDVNGIYEVVVYPAERLYELDKIRYKYRNGYLLNHSEHIRYQKVASK